MIPRILSAAVLGGALLSATPILADPPVPVSPGNAVGAPVRGACPTFSWSRASGAAELELVVFPVTPEGELAAAPALAVRLPAGTQSWTPAADRCLQAGGRYAWSLRELGEEPAATWSEAAIFEVAKPSRAEVDEALETLRRFMQGASPEATWVEEVQTRDATTPQPRSEESLRSLGSSADLVPRTAIYAVESSSDQLSYGVYARTDSSWGAGVFGHATLSGGETTGVQGSSSSSQGIGVWGVASAPAGSTRGVVGQSQSPEGFGVYGVGNVLTGEAVGVRGLSKSTQGVGVWGEAPAIGGKAVFGYAAATSGENFGVYGISESSAGWAGFFGGRVGITGSLSKGSGSFRIDHPLDPANRFLSHSFVESPDMMNVYNGNATLDEKGSAWIELPEWFEALNRDFRFQLTPLFRPAPGLHVAATITGNRFRIAGGEPGLEVSWQVTGIRRDAYAEEHPIVVEEDKGELRGLYLHPEAHGQPVELAIGRTRAANTALAASQTAGTSGQEADRP